MITVFEKSCYSEQIQDDVISKEYGTKGLMRNAKQISFRNSEGKISSKKCSSRSISKLVLRNQHAEWIQMDQDKFQ
jgi:hypothetical protein